MDSQRSRRLALERSQVQREPGAPQGLIGAGAGPGWTENSQFAAPCPLTEAVSERGWTPSIQDKSFAGPLATNLALLRGSEEQGGAPAPRGAPVQLGGGAPGRLSTCWFLTQGRPGKSHQGAQEPLWAPLGTFILTKGFVWKQIAPKKREIPALPARLPREPRDPLPAPEEAEGPSLLVPRPRPLPSCASKVLPPTGGGWLTQKELGLLCPQKQPLETRHQHKAGGRESRQPTHAGSMCLRPREGQRLALVTRLWDRQKQPHRGRVLSPPKPLARCHPPSPTASTSWATWCHLRLCGSSERPRWDTARSPPCSESTSVLAARPRPGLHPPRPQTPQGRRAASPSTQAPRGGAPAAETTASCAQAETWRGQ